MKECCTCKKEKSLNDFYKNRTKNDGRSPICKPCAKKYAQENKVRIQQNARDRRKDNPQSYKDKDKLYRDANKDKKRDVNKKYRENNKDRINKRTKVLRDLNRDAINSRARELSVFYRIKNKESIANSSKKWYDNNRERALKYSSDYMKVNRGRYNAYQNKRRALKLQATPTWSEEFKIIKLYEKTKELEELLGIKLEVDHIVPLNHPNVCGLHVWANLQVLEASLNRQKSNLFKGE